MTTMTRRKLIGSGTGAALAAPAALPLAAYMAGCGDDESAGVESDSASGEAAKGSASEPPPRDGDEALERLLEGNRSFIDDEESKVGPYTVRRVELAEGQEPFAVVLGCADSRVPPEVIFDQGLGDLFVVRVAGNTADAPEIVGSVEYGVAELGSVLVMVLGHQKCGAVVGAVEAVTEGAELPGSIADVIEPIVPVVEELHEREPDLSESELLERSIRDNVLASAEQLERRSELIAEAVSSGKLKIVGAEYLLESGEVRVL